MCIQGWIQKGRTFHWVKISGHEGNGLSFLMCVWFGAGVHKWAVESRLISKLEEMNLQQEGFWKKQVKFFSITVSWYSSPDGQIEYLLGRGHGEGRRIFKRAGSLGSENEVHTNGSPEISTVALFGPYLKASETGAWLMAQRSVWSWMPVWEQWGGYCRYQSPGNLWSSPQGRVGHPRKKVNLPSPAFCWV